MKALLMLENGMTFEGLGFGDEHDTLCEVVFNSAMCGYPELLTDPSYAGQGVVMAYPLIGNYGVCYDDMESVRPWVSAYIVHTLSEVPSNFRCDVDLNTFLKNNHIPGLQDVDTRTLTKVLRESGTMRGMIAYGDHIDADTMKNKIRSFTLNPTVPIVSCQESSVYGDGPIRVALPDYGVKNNIIRSLVKRGCTVKRFSYDTSFEEMMEFKPDGIMLTNGPGDPKDCKKSISELKKVYSYGIPTFAICLGHQLMALAMGFDTYKLKYGHRGINHPVKDLSENRVFITSQNHGYVVNGETIDPSVADIRFISMNDGSIEGLTYKSGKVFSVQFHPEASPGPLDTGFLFDKFITLMGGSRL
ncbi:Carbamoyl-phosphate synthase small chain [Caprobacter fermentans]|uniref:Carbamoyl phosphate synthase small chain n=1 Tax=Caproicibacter fermentans TaxID=2576756 RepID=A0A6N8I363_9FIRM|nr:carbamoyl phosphate synthase small subunit [Caproicibacter fermentans]MVB11953.1 Carbamoyl-phosphate synthase small chain [Caproicibacter fermentans]OCM99820.1 carbamoyl phosphate synthase small subunit [Clostridium sp. W14A]QNK41184.1 carbamoyl phosphate synthase small subunit [Caproicibacter fermentans]